MRGERTGTDREALLAAATWIRERTAIAIVSHENPDGDSLGCSLALALGLDQLGKRSTVVLPEPVPSGLAWLPAIDRVVVSEVVPEGHAVVALIECSDFGRSGVGGIEGLETLNIDHHAKNGRYADVDWVEPDAAAAGVMMHELLRELGADVTPDMATLLYVAVLTDTGSFQHSNTDVAALTVAADLVARGADPELVASRTYRRTTKGRLRLLQHALDSLVVSEGERVATMTLPLEAFATADGERDTEGIINHAQDIEGVSATALFKEVDERRYRVSLRSDGSADVGRVAASFGGGGHARAAGCEMHGDLDSVRARVLEAIRRELQAGTGASS